MATEEEIQKLILTVEGVAEVKRLSEELKKNEQDILRVGAAFREGSITEQQHATAVGQLAREYTLLSEQMAFAQQAARGINPALEEMRRAEQAAAAATREAVTALDRETAAAIEATRAQRLMAQVLAETEAKQGAVVAATAKAGAAAMKLGDGGRNMGVALMAASNMTQDFAASSGDLGQKLNSIVNNIPLLVMGLGGPQGMAAAAMVAGQAVVSLIRNWDTLAGTFSSRNPVPKATDDLKAMEEQLKKSTKELEELHKKTSLSNAELATFNKLTAETADLEDKLAEARKEREFFKGAAAAPFEPEEERQKAVKAFLRGQGKEVDRNLEAVIRGWADATGTAIDEVKVGDMKRQLREGLARGEGGVVKRLLEMIDATKEQVYSQEAVAKLAEADPERMKAEEKARQNLADFESKRKRDREEAEKLTAQGEEFEREAREEDAKRAREEAKRKARVAEVATPFAAQMEKPLEQAIRDREGRLRQSEEQVRRELGEQVVTALGRAGVDPGMAREIAESFLAKAMKAVRDEAIARLPVGAAITPAPETAEAMLKAARALERAGDTIGALAALRALQAAHPAAPESATAGERIEELRPPAPEPAGLPPAIAEPPGEPPPPGPQAAVAPAMGFHEAIAAALIGAVPARPPAPEPRQSPLERLTEGTFLAGLSRSIADGIGSAATSATTKGAAGPISPYSLDTAEEQRRAAALEAAKPNALGRFLDFMGTQRRHPVETLPSDRRPPAAPPVPPPPPPGPQPEPVQPLDQGPGMFAAAAPEVGPLDQGPGMFAFGPPVPEPPKPVIPGAPVVPPKPTREEEEARRRASLTPAQRATYDAGPRPPSFVPPRPTADEERAKRLASLTDEQRESLERAEAKARAVREAAPPPPVGPPQRPPGPGTIGAEIERGKARTRARAARRTPTGGVAPRGGTVEDRIARAQRRRAAKAAARREEIAQRDRMKAGLPAVAPPTPEQAIKDQAAREAREKEALAKRIYQGSAAETGTQVSPEQAREAAGQAPDLRKQAVERSVQLQEQGLDANEATLRAMQEADAAMRQLIRRAVQQQRAAELMGRQFAVHSQTALNFGGQGG